ncbi:RNA binding motif protein [Chamberlinius hualienensis]
MSDPVRDRRVHISPTRYMMPHRKKIIQKLRYVNHSISWRNRPPKKQSYFSTRSNHTFDQDHYYIQSSMKIENNPNLKMPYNKYNSRKRYYSQRSRSRSAIGDADSLVRMPKKFNHKSFEGDWMRNDYPCRPFDYTRPQRFPFSQFRKSNEKYQHPILHKHLVMVYGVPCNTVPAHILHFFIGLSVHRNGIVVIPKRRGERHTFAFVSFSSKRDKAMALQISTKYLNDCIVEVLAATKDDIRAAFNCKPIMNVSRSYPEFLNVRPTDCCLVEGLPFEVDNRDVYERFERCGCAPTAVHLMRGKNGKTLGVAVCEFASYSKCKLACKLNRKPFNYGYKVTLSIQPVSRRCLEVIFMSTAILQTPKRLNQQRLRHHDDHKSKKKHSHDLNSKYNHHNEKSNKTTMDSDDTQSRSSSSPFLQENVKHLDTSENEIESGNLKKDSDMSQTDNSDGSQDLDENDSESRKTVVEDDTEA